MANFKLLFLKGTTKTYELIEVACAIIIKDNKFLVTQRSEEMALPLKWEFPGGKVEANESPEDCLKREIKEELNLDISIAEKLNENQHVYESFSIRLIPYIVKIKSGNIILSEHRDYKFLNKNELLDLDWAEADIPIVHQLLKREL